MMTDRFTSEQIDQQAAQWAARRRAGLATVDQNQAFEVWLKADARHLGAYARAEAVLAQFDRLGSVGADLLRQGQAKDVLRVRRRAALVATAAAGLVVTGLGGGMAWRYLTQESYTTRTGETRVVVLSDGSVVTLNTNSRISVEYSQEERRISLVQGEALFEVAKNKHRPFIVTAADTRVRAVGTRFTVENLADSRVKVLVQEGVVEITRPQVPEASPVRLSANHKAIAPLAAPVVTEEVNPSQVARDMAWRVGRIAFDNESLRNARDDFSRYSDIHIVLDPSIEEKTITGLFVTTDPVGFARAAAISLNLQASIGNGVVKISAK